MITNDAVIMGMLAVILGGVFITESSQNSALKKILLVRSGSIALLLCSFSTEQFRHHRRIKL